MRSNEAEAHERFNQAVLPHLDAAYNLARWLAKNEDDADDIVQESCLRALKFLRGFTGVDARAWLLRIVRNTFYDAYRKRRNQETGDEFEAAARDLQSAAPGPDELLLQNIDIEALRGAIEELPDESREVLILREMEGLQYEQISEITGIPIGTVMSRLSRARASLRERLAKKEGSAS
jgi:RNA polymerase sigma-70 factor (ECF subfamily)